MPSAIILDSVEMRIFCFKSKNKIICNKIQSTKKCFQDTDQMFTKFLGGINPNLIDIWL